MQAIGLFLPVILNHILQLQYILDEIIYILVAAQDLLELRKCSNTATHTILGEIPTRALRNIAEAPGNSPNNKSTRTKPDPTALSLSLSLNLPSQPKLHRTANTSFQIATANTNTIRKRHKNNATANQLPHQISITQPLRILCKASAIPASNLASSLHTQPKFCWSTIQS